MGGINNMNFQENKCPFWENEEITDDVIIFGINILGIVIAQYLQKKENKKVIITDNSLNKQNKKYIYGLCSIAPSEINVDCTCIISVEKMEYLVAIEEQLKKMGCKRIIKPNIEKVRQYGNEFSDEEYIRCLWSVYFGYEIDLEHPRTFNEKIQWLKLYDRNSNYKKMVDKYEAKKYAKEVIGKNHIIPTIGIYDSVEEIDFQSLPEKFVMKGTHDCRSVVLCEDKKNMDMDSVKKNLNDALKKNHYYTFREWAYKEVKPRIIVEKYMEDENQKDGLIDYKFYCFNGKPQVIYVASNSSNKAIAKGIYLTLDWNIAPYERTDWNAFNKYPKNLRCCQRCFGFRKNYQKNLSLLE